MPSDAELILFGSSSENGALFSAIPELASILVPGSELDLLVAETSFLARIWLNSFCFKLM